MKAMVLERTNCLESDGAPLRMVDLPTPEIEDDEVLIKVSACGVCHTELDEIEGRLTPPHLPVIPGHEVVGHVAEIGANVTRFAIGDRVGVGWIARSSGETDENLSSNFVATGCDVNGGYADYMRATADYVVAIPDGLNDVEVAPLLCAGAIGFRALRLAQISDGQVLGLMGFGGSAHLVLPTAKHLYPRSPVYVFTRDESVQRFAVELGADWAGGVEDEPPQLCRSIIDTTPAWRPVVESMKKLQPGGRLVINAIRKEDNDKNALLQINYHEHLWMEREIKSVANLTYADIEGFIPLAASIPLKPRVTVYPLSEANQALCDLRRGQITGANVLAMD